MNGVERGIPLTQLIESKQKQVASFTKLLHTPGMESQQKTKILDKVVELMEEIQADEKFKGQVSQNKR
jgi:hypothetical protein